MNVWLRLDFLARCGVGLLGLLVNIVIDCAWLWVVGRVGGCGGGCELWAVLWVYVVVVAVFCSFAVAFCVRL